MNQLIKIDQEKALENESENSKSTEIALYKKLVTAVF